MSINIWFNTQIQPTTVNNHFSFWGVKNGFIGTYN